MNITPSLFRKLLLLSIILAAIGILLDIVFPNLMPKPLYQAQQEVDQSVSSNEFIILLLISIPLVIVNSISVVGLFCFRPWAPRIAIIATLLSFMIYPLLGYSLSSGWALALTDFSTLLWGVVLTLTYCSPIRKRFAYRRS
jgi:urea transporter